MQGDGAGWCENLVLRSLRQVEQGLRARLLSIEHDALGALSLYESVNSLPVFGNARAGAWYVPPGTRGWAGSCAFKSADGHYGQWSSSLRRPNVSVLKEAVACGGVVIVDVTRKGKTWPDSLAKTVPIWCAVVNSVAGLECEDEVRVHMDVSPSERSRIDALLPVWIANWNRSGVQLPSLVPGLRGSKPLRPLWVRPGRLLWPDGIPLTELAFTPVVCVSASAPVMEGQRAFVESRIGEETVAGVRFPPRLVGFPYVQGAGDDEEAWCKGLTSELFWKNRDLLLDTATCAGDDALHALGTEDHLVSVIRGICDTASAIDTNENLVHRDDTTSLWGSKLRLLPSSPSAIYGDVRRVCNKYNCVIVFGATAPPHATADCKGDKDCTSADDVSSEYVMSTGIVHWMPLLDLKGKRDLKHGFGRALGPCLTWLRECCVDNGEEALICCTHRHGDWCAGLAIAWLAWQCAIESGDGDRYEVLGHRRSSIGVVSKECIQSTMLRLLAARPELQLSRATLKQLNRFFQSPMPSSAVVNE